MADHINEEATKRHAFTPKHILSPSTIEKLVKELTSGRIMSRAGLDNIDVEKGTENFSAMRQITETLAPFARDDSMKKLMHVKSFIRLILKGTSNRMKISMSACVCIVGFTMRKMT